MPNKKVEKMDIINIEASDYTPKIILDKSKGHLEISGKSCPEDPLAFYEPIFEWFDRYAEAPLNEMEFNFKLSYYNTATSKIIMMMMQRLEELENDGNEVLIKWHYHIDDEDMLESGEDYAEMIDVKFEFISYQ